MQAFSEHYAKNRFTLPDLRKSAQPHCQRQYCGGSEEVTGLDPSPRHTIAVYEVDDGLIAACGFTERGAKRSELLFPLQTESAVGPLFRLTVQQVNHDSLRRSQPADAAGYPRTALTESAYQFSSSVGVSTLLVPI
jgi:hypothetical protein